MSGYSLPGSSSAAGSWYYPVWSSAPQSDPNSLVASSAYVSPGVLEVTTQNSGVVSFSPATGARWTAVAKGALDGEDIANLVAGDILRTFVRTNSPYVDKVFWVGFYNSANNHGAAFGIAWNTASGAYRSVRSVNTGAGWSAPSEAAGASVLTAGGLGCADPGASGSASLSNTTVAMDADTLAVPATNQAVTRSAANLIGPFDTVFIEVGNRTGVGGSNVTLQLAGSFFFAHVDDADPTALPTGPAPVTTPTRFLILGDSNGNGTTVDVPWTGAAIQPGWTVRDQGVNLAVYPGPAPSAGLIPYLIDRCIAAGAATGWVVRESENGRAANERSGMTAQISDAFTNVAALGADSPQVIIWYLGANDSNTLDEASKFYVNMYWNVAQVAWRYPDAHHVFVAEWSTDSGPGGLYEYLSLVRAQLLLVSQQANGTYLDSEALGAALIDPIHFSQGIGGGQNVLALNVPIGS